MKAFLVYHDIVPQRTHDLVKLLFECADYDEEFMTLKDDTFELNPFAHRTRYPDHLLMLDLSVAQDAIQRAEKICEFVVGKIW